MYIHIIPHTCLCLHMLKCMYVAYPYKVHIDYRCQIWEDCLTLYFHLLFPEKEASDLLGANFLGGFMFVFFLTAIC